MGTDLDTTDWAIIGQIQRDARLSFNQIAKRVNLSAAWKRPGSSRAITPASAPPPPACR